MSKQKKRWNDLPCPQCKELARSDASRCPHCGHQFSDEEKAERKSQVKAGLIGTAIVVIGLGASLSYCSNGDDDSPIGAVGSPVMQTAMDTFFLDLGKASSPCDEAVERMGSVTDETIVYDVAKIANDITNSCTLSSGQVRAVSIPDAFSGKAKGVARKVLEACSNSQIARQMVGTALGEMLDSNASPTKVAAVGDAKDYAELKIAECGAELVALTSMTGTKLQIPEE